MKRRSIAQLFRTYTLILIVVAIFIASATYLYIQRSVDALYLQQEQVLVKSQAKQIADIINFYQNTANSLASSATVVDLLSFKQTEEIERWALLTRSLLPDAIGLALLTPEGEVIGNRTSFRVGEQCLIDLKHKIQGQDVANPPVHREIQELAHFDILAPVTSETGENLGLLFMSFSIDILQNAVEQMSSEGHYYALLDALGQPIAAAGGSPDGNMQKVQVPGTDWQLSDELIFTRSGNILLGIGVSHAVAATVMLSVFFLLVLQFIKLVRGDMAFVEGMLKDIQYGDYHPTTDYDSHLKETRKIYKNIAVIAKELYQKQADLTEQSSLDELTLLANRYALKTNQEHYRSLAQRGQSVAVLLIDMDRFKQVNDTRGHDVGDEVLRLFAVTLKSMIRGTDMAVRLGGDEFLVLLVNISDADIVQWFERVSQQFSKMQQHMLGPMLVEEQLVGLSGGYSYIDESDEVFDYAVKRADGAVYKAKAMGRGTIYTTTAEGVIKKPGLTDK